MSQLPIATKDDVAVRPDTGELVQLNDPAQAAAWLRDLQPWVNKVRRRLEQTLIAESERLGTRTLHYGPVTAEIRGGSKTDWDIEQLETDLADLGLPEERINALIRTKIIRDVNANVAKQLAAANPDYAKAIQAAQTPVETRLSVYCR